MAKTVFERRIALLKNALRAQKLDSLIITKDVNVSYMSGFAGHDAIAIITPGAPVLIADSRYIEEARGTVKGFDVRLAATPLRSIIADVVKKNGLKKVGFESADLSYEAATRLEGGFRRGVMVPVKDLVEDLRAVKDSGEIKLIRRSIGLTKMALAKIIPQVKAGTSEEHLARMIEIFFIKAGAKPGFDPIVAADANASKPHSAPTARKVAKNSCVMIDVGCSLNGYNADMTRVVAVGKVNPKIKRIWDVVRSAREKAIAAIRPGVRIANVDAAARAHIAEEGFGKYFGHALGHGIGMEVHEGPTISGMSTGVLKPGMVFTVEPAIYIPKLGGIRIEDMVLVTDKGCEVLSS